MCLAKCEYMVALFLLRLMKKKFDLLGIRQKNIIAKMLSTVIIVDRKVKLVVTDKPHGAGLENLLETTWLG